MNIHEAKQVLREAGYFVDNLWHVDDVKNATEVSLSANQAIQVLSMALTNDNTTHQIWEAIQMATEIYKDCPYVNIPIDKAIDYADEKIDNKEWDSYCIPELVNHKVIYHD